VASQGGVTPTQSQYSTAPRPRDSAGAIAANLGLDDSTTRRELANEPIVAELLKDVKYSKSIVTPEGNLDELYDST
jgi:hypothetical protein